MIAPAFSPFWKSGPLSERELRLLNAVLSAHEESTKRQNISSVVIANAARGSGDYVQALCSGLLTTGGPHAPLAETYDLLESVMPLADADRLICNGGKVPGWGNSFHRGVPDPLWQNVDALLLESAPKIREKVDRITHYLHGRGKFIFPNPSCYTAAAALALEIPRAAVPFLFVAGRLNGWSKLILENT